MYVKVTRSSGKVSSVHLASVAPDHNRINGPKSLLHIVLLLSFNYVYKVINMNIRIRKIRSFNVASNIIIETNVEMEMNVNKINNSKMTFQCLHKKVFAL